MVNELGQGVDWDSAAADYAEHRPPFPDLLYERLAEHGIGLAGQTIVDLGTGIGTPSLGFARRGCRVIGVDMSAGMLAHASRSADNENLDFDAVVAPAEATGLPDGVADAVTVGQAWHWFRQDAAAREIARLLQPEGRAAVCMYVWLVGAHELVDATFDVLRRQNPEVADRIPLEAHERRDTYAGQLANAGLAEIARTTDRMLQPFTADAWRGRLRASTWVDASLSPEAVAAVDEELAEVLSDVETIEVPHELRTLVVAKTDRS